MKFPPQQNTTNRPPISSIMSVPHSDRMDDDGEEGSGFSGYDRPRSTRGRNTTGNGGVGGGILPTGRNLAGGEDAGDSNPSLDSDHSDSPPLDPCNILGSRKDH